MTHDMSVFQLKSVFTHCMYAWQFAGAPGGWSEGHLHGQRPSARILLQDGQSANRPSAEDFIITNEEKIKPTPAFKELIQDLLHVNLP